MYQVPQADWDVPLCSNHSQILVRELFQVLRTEVQRSMNEPSGTSGRDQKPWTLKIQ
jgi:hypothetical protein